MADSTRRVLAPQRLRCLPSRLPPCLQQRWFPHTKPYLMADWRHTHVKCCDAPRAKTLAVGTLRRLAAPTITSAPVPAACSNAELLLISFVRRLRQTGVVPTWIVFLGLRRAAGVRIYTVALWMEMELGIYPFLYFRPWAIFKQRAVRD